MNVQEFLETWITAERSADVDHLDPMLTEDFTGIGPLGFTLSKKDWLNRHGPLRYQALDLTGITTRTYGEVTVVNATQHQEATFNGNPVPGTFRTTVVLVAERDGWKIANVQFSGGRSN